MASDTYYKEMWLRRNRTAVQVVIVLLTVIALMLVIQFASRGRPDSSQTLQGAGPVPGTHRGQPVLDPDPGPDQARPDQARPDQPARVISDDDEDDDDFDPNVEDPADVGEKKDEVSDCCTVYDLWQLSRDDFECSPLSKVDEELPETLVCFPPDQDPHTLLNTDMAKLILKHLTRSGSTYGFIDVGAGHGALSFLAASVERNVVAVESNIENIARFHKATKLGRYERWITLLNNQVSPSRGLVSVVQGKPQVKKNLLDDLPAFCKFRKAIMRLEVGGEEHRAFQHAKFLFKEIQITYVFFPWHHMKGLESTEDKDIVEDMMKYFNKRGYVPRGFDGKVLSIKKWHQWPDQIYWQKM